MRAARDEQKSGLICDVRCPHRLLFNEYLERVVDACVEYVLDSSARGRDWKEELAGLEVTLRSQVRLLFYADLIPPKSSYD